MATEAQKITWAEVAAPSTPAAGKVVTYAKSDGLMYSKDDAGTETAMAAGAAGAPTNADYLVGTANGSLSAEIVVGTSPGGELGGTWASPTVDALHSGSRHTDNAGLLGRVAYKHGSDASLGNSSSGTLGDVRAADIVVTFTAPASTNVLVKCCCLIGLASGGGGYMGLRESTTQVGTQSYLGSQFNNNTGTWSWTFDVTGISAGSHTYKLAFLTSGAQIDVYGGPTFGNVVMEVWAAP